jgi:hypothetical protein
MRLSVDFTEKMTYIFENGASPTPGARETMRVRRDTNDDASKCRHQNAGMGKSSDEHQA